MNFSLTTDPVLLGNLENIPPRESKIVRVFVSSTFTDMSEERNILMKETFPKLQRYFRSKGFEFQVIDMRWGVREESVHDHMATKLCTEEILNTQKISRGVSFLALLGDKYGSCPLPAEIPTRDYKIFIAKLRSAKISTQVLEEWYRMDENDVPPQFVLLPLSDKFPHFNSSDPDHVEKRIKERNQWAQDQISIRTLLQKAADLAFRAGDITEEHKHRYFVAVTEKEITSGILSDPEASRRALCFIRQFTHLKSSDPLAPRFADIENGKYHQNSRLLLQQLKTDRIPAHIPPQNLFCYQVEWTPKGVNPSKDIKHLEYLEKLTSDVYDAVIRLSEQRIRETTPADPPYAKDWYYDMIHHLDFCVKKVRMYEMRRKLEVHCQRTLRLNKFQIKRPKFFKFRRKKNTQSDKEHKEISEVPEDEICEEEPEVSNELETPDKKILPPQEDAAKEEGHQIKEAEKESGEDEKEPRMVTCHKPVIISGPSGYGKTSLMAKIFEKFCSKHQQHSYDWLQSDSVIKVLRFLGTSPLSCSIREVLLSVIRQIWASLGIRPDNCDDILNGSFANMTEYFNELLWSLETFPGKILIMLDSVDQLSPDDGAFYMHWLPLNFPENVYFFISTLPESNEILSNIQRLLHDSQCYIEIRSLGMSTAENILAIYGKIVGRTLTFRQKDIILKAFQHCSQPMFLKLAFELAKEWRSFTDPKTLVVGKNCKELINQLFTRLELQHGRSVVWALQYITSSRVGLTDAEIEDLLSLDDHVLQDVYIYHLPPEPSIIRLPPMLWRRIRQQLNEYLVEKESDGTTVINWYHRQFWEAATIHFAQSPKIHHHMASYFSGIWHGRPKPLTLYKGKKAEYPNAYRNVPAMPNTFGTDLPNLRKLTELPYHLARSYIIDAAADVLCVFNFLACKLRYTGLKNVLSDFRVYFDTFAPHREKFADLVFVRMAQDAGKSLEELGVGDLTEQTLQVKIVYDLLVMSGDILKSDWSEFAANVTGRLSAYWKTYPRIERLVKDAKRWLYGSELPLLVPQFPCVQPPGGLLRTSINHSVHIPGRPRDYGNILYMSDKGLLYVREQQWDQKDVIRVYDIANSGEMVQTLRLGFFSESLRFLHDEKFLLVRVLKRRSETKDQTDVLLDFETKEKVWFPSETQFLIVSPSEEVLILVHDDTQFSQYVFEQKKILKLVVTVTLETEAKIFRGALAPDGDHLTLATTDGLIRTYSLKQQQLLHTFGYAVEDGDEPGELSSFKMIITKDNRLICRGMRSDVVSKLFVYDLNTGDGVTVCEGNNYPIDILLLHKSEKWAAGATTYMVDNITGGVAAKLNRPLYIWDLETGKTYFRIKGNKGPYSAVAFLGENHQFVAFSRKFDPGVIIVHIGTPDKISFTAAELLKLGGHSKAVCCLLKDPSETMLITASPDNTIKIWDLSTTVALCKMAVDNKDMQKPIDRRKKEDQKKFFVSTKEGTDDPLRFVQYRGNLGESLNKKLMGGCHAYTIVLSKNQRYVASGCMFGRVLFFDLATGDFIVVQAHALYVKRVHTLLFTADDTHVISAATEGRVMMWDYKTGALDWCFPLQLPCHSICMAGKYLFAGHHLEEDPHTNRPKSVCNVWNTEIGQRSPELNTFVIANCFWAMACTSDASVGVTWNGFIMKMFELKTDEITDLKPPETTSETEEQVVSASDRATVVLVTPDDKFAAAAVFRTLYIVNLEKKCLFALQFKSRLKNALCSWEHPEIMLIGRYRCIDFVNIPNGSIISTVTIHEEFVEAFQLTCRDSFLVTVSQDKSTKLFFWEKSEEKHSLKCLTKLTFHCPIRIICVAQDLSFVLIGPESAAPIAVLTLNQSLRNKVSEYVPEFPGVPEWLVEETKPRECSQDSKDPESMNSESEDRVSVMSPDVSSECAWEVSQSEVKLYVSGTLSMSVSRDGFASCHEIASALSLNSSSASSSGVSANSSLSSDMRNAQRSNLMCVIL